MYFGNVSGTTITMAYNCVEKEITQNKRVKGKVNIEYLRCDPLFFSSNNNS